MDSEVQDVLRSVTAPILFTLFASQFLVPVSNYKCYQILVYLSFISFCRNMHIYFPILSCTQDDIWYIFVNFAFFTEKYILGVITYQFLGTLLIILLYQHKCFPGGSEDKESACQCRRSGFHPQRRKWQPTPVFLPGKSHGQRSLVVYSP